MASKQYTSIIRLFDHCGISYGIDFNLSRAKKQLQAEFSIADGGFIEVDGHTYTKHDVLEELDHPDFNRRLDYHRRIWASKQILRMLEESEANMATIRTEFNSFFGDTQFDEFFSPYFVGPFTYILRNLLAQNRLKDAGDLLSYEEFLQPSEREEAFLPVRLFFEENERLLRNVNGENYSMMRSKINHWVDADWHHFFNNLPDEFYEEKNDITAKLINLTVSIQKSHKSDTRAISEQLINLNNPPENLGSIIRSNHSVYSGEESGNFSWRTVAWIVFLLFSIGRLSNMDCNDSKSNTDYFKYNPPVFRLDTAPFSLDCLDLRSDKVAPPEVKERLQKLVDSINRGKKPLPKIVKENPADTASHLRQQD